MKKLIILIAIIASVVSVLAQDSLYVYKTGGDIDGEKISSVDSITFSSTQDSLYLMNSGGIIASYGLSSVDSISFARVINSSSTPEYVEINGVKWATKNVNTPGTFTSAPEASGMFYQWNRKVGWPATGAIGSITATNGSTTWSSYWDGGYATPSSFDIWVTANDPSPTGYRVPTSTEIQLLLNTTYVSNTWTTQNGKYGRKFTDIASGNSIFLPAVGYRYRVDGTLTDAGLQGAYWSGTVGYGSYCDYAYYLYFYSNSSSADWYYHGRPTGLQIRPVVK